MEKTDVNTALAIFYIATAVMLVGGLVLVPLIEEAQATTSPSRAGEHISEQGRAHQSERGAANSGVIDEPVVDGVYCVTATSTISGQHTICFSTQEECQGWSGAILGNPDIRIDEECQEFEEPPAGATCVRYVEGQKFEPVPCDEL